MIFLKKCSKYCKIVTKILRIVQLCHLNFQIFLGHLFSGHVLFVWPGNLSVNKRIFEDARNNLVGQFRFLNLEYSISGDYDLQCEQTSSVRLRLL